MLAYNTGEGCLQGGRTLQSGWLHRSLYSDDIIRSTASRQALVASSSKMMINNELGKGKEDVMVYFKVMVAVCQEDGRGKYHENLKPEYSPFGRRIKTLQSGIESKRNVLSQKEIVIIYNKISHTHYFSLYVYKQDAGSSNIFNNKSGNFTTFFFP